MSVGRLPIPWTRYGGPNGQFRTPNPLPGRGLDGPVLWRRPIGPGTSGIVTDGRLVVVHYCRPDDKGESGVEIVAVFDAATGAPKWERRLPVARLKGQQSYSGDPIRPQATPALVDGRLCTLGYTGVLTVFDPASGKVLWERDLVRDLGATPVQFGFSASPVPMSGTFLVHVGGRECAVAAFDVRTGAVRWKSEPAEPSYATPVVMDAPGGPQVLQVTRDALLGLRARDGATLWRWALPKQGLTNVPTPIPLSTERILVSGQGVVGTRLLTLGRLRGEWDVREEWQAGPTPYFYANWIVDRDVVMGTQGAFAVALRLADGKQAWKVRGQAEANVVRAGDETLWLRGDGLLTRATVGPDGIATVAERKVLEGRTWTAPSLAGDTLLVRDEREIVALRLAG